MEKLKFERKGIIYSLLKLTWEKDNEPSDICEYRNKVIKAILINIFLLPGFIIRVIIRALLPKNSEYKGNGVGFTILHTLFFIVFVGVSFAFADSMETEWSAIYLLYSFFFMVGSATVIVLTILLGEYTFEVYSKIKYRDDKEPSKIRLAYNSWREKWCTPIEWINKK